MPNQTTSDEPAGQEAHQGTPPGKRRWRALRILVLVFVAALVACKPDCFVCGLLGKPPWTFVVAFVGLPLALAGLAYFLYRLIRKALRWRTTQLWTKLTYVSLLVCLYYAPIVIPSVPHRLGFYYWAKNHVDIPAAITWAEAFTVSAEDANADSDDAKVPLESLPKSIQLLVSGAYLNGKYVGGSDLGPRAFYDKKAKALVLLWGSGMMGSWGITIGRDVVNRTDVYDKIRIGSDAYVWERE